MSVSNIELERKIEAALVEYGVPLSYATILTKDISTKARKKVTPKQRNVRVKIEDSYRHNGLIRLLIKEGHSRGPEEILSDYISNIKGYPKAERWLIEKGYGFPYNGMELFHATVPIIKRTVVKPSSKKEIEQLSPSESAQLLEKLQGILAEK